MGGPNRRIKSGASERNATEAWNALENLEKTSPGFDGGTYGMKRSSRR